MSRHVVHHNDSLAIGAQEAHWEPTAEAVEDELERILSSKVFRNTQIQRRLLRYLVEQSLHGSRDQIKGYTIGIEVFGRKEAFDARRDNVVRAHVRKLRGTLAKYYQGEGATDSVRIDFPLGTYVPAFRLAEAPHAERIPPPFTPLVNEEESAERHWSRGFGGFHGFRAFWKLKWAIGAGLLIAICLVAATPYLIKSRKLPRAGISTTPSIAVLAFRNLNNEKEEEFFSDGLTEDLTDSLARIPGLRVVAPSSAFLFRRRDVDVREVGRKLNVDVVLEGSVRRFENRIRITAQLSDAASGFHIWSSSYEKEITDVLAIQSEIADSITNALGVTLAGLQSHGAPPGGSAPDPDTYQDYLKGRYLFEQGTQRSLDSAIEFFERTIGRDPRYAPAYEGLARCYAVVPAYQSAAPPGLVKKIIDTASMALSLDGKLGQAHVDLARAYMDEFEWPAAEQEIRKALEISPGIADGYEVNGLYLAKMGRLPEALIEYKKSMNLDPVSASANRLFGRTLYFSRRYDEAIDFYKQTLELDPNSAADHRGLGIAYVMKGQYSLGIAEMESARGLTKDDAATTVQTGYAYAVAGRTSVAREILEKMLKSSSPEHSHSLGIAQIYIGLGDKDQAFEWLRRAIDERNVNLTLKADPIYDALRHDPRFLDLLRRMKLEP